MKKWKNGSVILACEELKERVKGKKIALMMNASAIHNDGRMLMDVIVEEKWADVAFFFGMEHGVRGNFYACGSDVKDIDEKTGVKIINLYQCPDYRPPVEDAQKVDAVVFCAQDIGIRHWTYTPWMIMLLDTAAQAGCEVIILDRPNPIRGDIVEGCCSEEKYFGTLLSAYDYPLRHGMTIGELAHMYNEEKHIGAKLTVLKMKGWTRDMWYEDTGLVWLPPSPNIPTVDTGLYFGATGLLQAADISLGIKTTTPFQYVGRQDFDGEKLAKELNSRGLEGVFFVPKYYMAATYASNGEVCLCDGVMIVIADRNVWRPVTTQLHIFDALAKMYGDKIDFEYSASYARKRIATDDLNDLLEKGESVLSLVDKWEKSAAEFAARREKYLLY